MVAELINWTSSKSSASSSSTSRSLRNLLQPTYGGRATIFHITWQIHQRSASFVATGSVATIIIQVDSFRQASEALVEYHR